MSKTSKKEVLIILWNEIFLENKRFSKRFSTSCRIFCTRLEIVVLLTSYTNLNIKDVLTGHIVYHKKKSKNIWLLLLSKNIWLLLLLDDKRSH